MNHTLIQYIRNSDRKPYGVVVATIRPSDNKVGIGFSVIKANSDDVFDAERGLEIAIGRAAAPQDRANRNGLFATLKKKNPEVYGAIYTMYNRALSYFKGYEVINP